MADFVVGEVVVVAQDGCLAQFVGKLAEGVPNALLLGRQFGRFLGRGGVGVGHILVFGLGRLLPPQLAQREGGQPFAPPLVAASADGDAVEPRPKSRFLGVELRQLAKSVLKRILQHLFRIFLVLEQAVDDPIHVGRLFLIQGGIRLRLTRQATADEPLGVVGWGWHSLACKGQGIGEHREISN